MANSIRHSARRSTLAALTGVAGLAGAAAAQCTPHWDVTIGNPGISGGYAAPIRGWTDGKLYIGGSFMSAGGSGANQYITRWDPATNTWSPLGSGVSGGFTNAFMTAILPYTPSTGGGERLVIAGFYDTAGGVPMTASLAMWNGASWEAMDTGWTGTTRGSIWSLAVWNGYLFAGGGVVNTPAMLGGRPWAGLDRWNGAGWEPIVTSSSGTITPNVFALQVFNDGSGEALYLIGRFSSLNGVPGTASIARWDGTNLTSVGGGLTPTSSVGDLEAATVFDDGTGPALYVAGSTVTGTGVSPSNVVRWDGHNWTSVGGMIGTGRLTSITAFNDGSGNKLYIGGTAMPQIMYFARWENNAWVTVGGGITGPTSSPFPSVFGLGTFQNNLYVGGSYTQVAGSLAANGMADWTSCQATCYANCDNSTATPILNVNDFICFQTQFAAGNSYANCDNSTVPPVLNVNDFVCFQTRFAAGCP